MGLKKIGPYELITPEKRKKTPDISTIENKDTGPKTINSPKKTKLLALLKKER